MEIVEGNILDIEKGIIAHQCNMSGVMNAGLARSIRQKYPLVFERYRRSCEAGLFTLGTAQVVKVSDAPLYVCNLAGQEGYGRNRRYTDYDALRLALRRLAQMSDASRLQVYLPYLMGCGLGGGDWTIVSSIIEKEIKSTIVVKL